MNKNNNKNEIMSLYNQNGTIPINNLISNTSSTLTSSYYDTPYSGNISIYNKISFYTSLLDLISEILNEDEKMNLTKMLQSTDSETFTMVREIIKIKHKEYIKLILNE